MFADRAFKVGLRADADSDIGEVTSTPLLGAASLNDPRVSRVIARGSGTFDIVHGVPLERATAIASKHSCRLVPSSEEHSKKCEAAIKLPNPRPTFSETWRVAFARSHLCPMSTKEKFESAGSVLRYV